MLLTFFLYRGDHVWSHPASFTASSSSSSADEHTLGRRSQRSVEGMMMMLGGHLQDRALA
jgi:hypothetical protein